MGTSLGDRLEVGCPSFYDSHIEMSLLCRQGGGQAVAIDTTACQHVAREVGRERVAVPGAFCGQEIVDLLLFIFDAGLVGFVFIREVLRNEGREVEFGDDTLELGELFRTGENRRQAVVVFRGNGIEFVVVATCAGHSKSQKGAGGDVDLLIDNVVEHLDLVLLGDELGAEGEEAGRDEAADVDVIWLIGGQEVSGDLFAHELIVGQIAIEGLDDVIAIAPGVGVAMVFIGTGGICVAGDIHPVPAPTFAVAG